LQVNRSTIYYKARGADVDDISRLNEIRDVWEQYPFYGYRRITKELQAKGYNVNCKCIQRLMRLRSDYAIYPDPNTSRRNKLHKVHPYKGCGDYKAQSSLDG
jgi:putative transposase